MRGFLIGRKAGVPAREFAAVEGATEAGILGEGGSSSSSSWDRLREDRVLRPSRGAGVGRPAGRVVLGREESVVARGVMISPTSSTESRWREGVAIPLALLISHGDGPFVTLRAL